MRLTRRIRFSGIMRATVINSLNRADFCVSPPPWRRRPTQIGYISLLCVPGDLYALMAPQGCQEFMRF
jgi:hypothetical protein